MYHIIKRGNYRKDLFESVGSAEAFLKKNEISQKEAMGAKEGKKSGLNGAKAGRRESPCAPDALHGHKAICRFYSPFLRFLCYLL
jgi:hypothetical protein